MRGYIGCRNRKIAMRDGDSLGTSGAAAGMEDERDLIGIRVGRAYGRRGTLPVSSSSGSGSRAIDGVLHGRRRTGLPVPKSNLAVDRVHDIYRDTGASGRECGFAARWWNDQQLRVCIGEIENKFIVAIGGIERRGCACDGCGEKTDENRDPIGQRDGNPVVPANPCGSEYIGPLPAIGSRTVS